MKNDVLKSTFRCPSCEFFSSSFPVQINSSATIDEQVRVAGLRELRRDNYQQILGECRQFFRPQARVMDVGCGHGWFVDAATEHGCVCSAVEPDAHMAQVVTSKGHHVYEGYFPEVVPKTEIFDVIIFNDVFEHIPDVGRLPGRIAPFLKNGGVLIINIPMSNGLIFRVSRLAASIGITEPLARMWQRGLPSPHVSYFAPENLIRLFSEADYDLVQKSELKSLITTGLFGRIRADARVGTVAAMATYTAALLMKTVSRAFPSDVSYFVFRPKPKQA